METQVNDLLNQFESGNITRRQLVKHLTAFAALAAGTTSAVKTATAQETENPTFKAVGLNHIALSVTDVPRSRDFYLKHLGMKIDRDSASRSFLTFPNGFLALFRGNDPGMLHYCYSIESYDVAEAVDTLNANGLNPRRQGNRVYFPDPDGITVQLAAPEHMP